MVGDSLFSWPVQQMYSSAMPAGIWVWNAVMSWRKECWRRKSLSSFGDGAKEEEETIEGFQLYSREWDRGLDLSSSRRGVGLPSSYLFLWEEWLLGWQEALAGSGGWDRATSGRGQLGSDSLLDPQEMCAWRGLQLALCCKVRGRTGGPGLGKQSQSCLFVSVCLLSQFTCHLHLKSFF